LKLECKAPELKSATENVTLTIDSTIPKGERINIYGSSVLQGTEGTVGEATYNATDNYGQDLINPK
jgi:hypothetical protein